MFKAAAPQRSKVLTRLLLSLDTFVWSTTSSCNKDPIGMFKVPAARTSAFIMGLKVIGTPGIGKTTKTGPMPTRVDPVELTARPMPN